MESLNVRELFYENNRLAEFTAQITGCLPYGDSYGIILDKTAFYPEGGGQPGDQGYIGSTKIMDTRRKDNTIIHLAKTPLDIGAEVSCAVDYNRRFHHMQHHTGEHILSGVLKKLYGCENVGFHMGEDYVTIDTDREVGALELDRAETMANNAIYENIPVVAAYPDEKALSQLDYRSKGNLTGALRIISIKGYDTCACCGLHCSSTGEVGVIKILSSQRYKGGVRIFLLCGLRALEDYRQKNKSLYTIAAMLSAKPANAETMLHQLKEDYGRTKLALSNAKSELLLLKAEKIPIKDGIAAVFEHGLSGDDLRKYCTYISQQPEAPLAFVFSQGEDGAYKYAVGSKSIDAREIAKQINTVLIGKGGGQKELAQGSTFAGKAAIEAFISCLHTALPQ